MFVVWFVKITSAPFLIVYFKLVVTDKAKRKQLRPKCIIIANHTSTWDPVLINYIFPTKRISFMTASELFRYNKLFSAFLTRMGAFSVNRNNPNMDVLGVSSDILTANKILGIFPEGRRSLDGELLPFSPGVVMIALNCDAPILPIYLSGQYGLFHRKRAVIGDLINLSDYCVEKHPHPTKIRELSVMLHDKMLNLAQQAKA